MDRQEVWEHVVSALEREFTSGEFGESEFRVVHNDSMRTVTIIEEWTSEAVTLLNATGSTFSHGGPMDDTLVVQIPLNTLV